MTRPRDHTPEELQDNMEEARVSFERWRQLRKCSTPRPWTREEEERLDSELHGQGDK